MIRELTEHPGWVLFVDRARASMFPRQERLLNGAPKTLEDYRRETGWLEGADFVLKVPAHVEVEVEKARQQIREDT